MVLHRADKAPAGRLYDLEDAFENAEFEYGGKRTDCSKVIFVLETEFAGVSELAADACGGSTCGVSPGASMPSNNAHSGCRGPASHRALTNPRRGQPAWNRSLEFQGGLLAHANHRVCKRVAGF